MEETLKQILGELQSVNKRIDGFDNRMNKFEQNVNKRMDGLDQRMDVFGQRMDGFGQRMDSLDQRMDGLDQRMDGFDKRLDGLDRNVLEIKDGQNQLGDNIINQVGSYIEGLAKHIDEKVTETNTTLESHQRIIDTLSARSVKHEGEINDLRYTIKS